MVDRRDVLKLEEVPSFSQDRRNVEIDDVLKILK